MRRWTISAARRFAPTSPACGTRHNIRGCFGHEHEPHSVVPARAGTHNRDSLGGREDVATAHDINCGRLRGVPAFAGTTLGESMSKSPGPLRAGIGGPVGS